MPNIIEEVEKATQIIKKSKHLIAFTGAGISVESGIPTFRGKGGLYEKVSSKVFDLDFFYTNTKECWYLLLKYILIPLQKAKPNKAHQVLAKFEEKGYIKAIITQNIDLLHEKAGSKKVYKFHGTSDLFKCRNCNKVFNFEKVISDELIQIFQDDILSENPDNFINQNIFKNFKVPTCPICDNILKPEIVFFKESIPEDVLNLSFYNAQISDCVIIIGTSGVVYPAALIPQIVKKSGGKIIEINPEPSEYTNYLSDIFIQQEASKGLEEIGKLILD